MQDALDAWRREFGASPDDLPSNSAAGIRALESRCHWLLYGAANADRDAAVGSQEAAEARQILAQLAAHLD